MTANIPTLECIGLSSERWTEVQPHLRTALSNLQLDEKFASVCLSADDLPSDGDAWYRIIRSNTAAKLPTLMIVCHPGVFGSHQGLATSASPALKSWESIQREDRENTDDLTEFSSVRTEAFLHHHLLVIDDLMTGKVVAEMVPKSLAHGFAMVWSVVVDGRLQRRHLPCYDLADRRGQFSRLFSTAGIILPGHWQLFQAMWDGSITKQQRVLEAVRQLPRV
ncbi:MAG: hypothetical protein ACI8S7_000665 [Candidatus Krumholzibacteriia bacterium]|jgi:hypothetical protein